MSEDTLLPFDLPSVARKKLSVGFDGGQLSSDAGVLVLRGVEMRRSSGWPRALRRAASIAKRGSSEMAAYLIAERLNAAKFGATWKMPTTGETIKPRTIAQRRLQHQWQAA